MNDYKEMDARVADARILGSLIKFPSKPNAPALRAPVDKIRQRRSRMRNSYEICNYSIFFDNRENEYERFSINPLLIDSAHNILCFAKITASEGVINEPVAYEIAKDNNYSPSLLKIECVRKSYFTYRIPQLRMTVYEFIDDSILVVEEI